MMEWHDVMVGADVNLFIGQVPDACVTVAVVGLVNLQRWHSAGHKVCVQTDTRSSCVLGDGAVKNGSVSRVQTAFQSLEPVALLAVLRHPTVGILYLGPLEHRLRGPAVAGAHISPDHVSHLNYRVRRNGDFVLEVAVRRFVHHVEAAAGDVELPSVEHTAYPMLLIPPKEQRSAAMRAKLFQQPNPSGGVPEGHQVFTQQPHPDRRAIWIGQLRC